MREIKFRAWVRFIQKIGRVDELNLESGSALVDIYPYSIESDAFDLMQYTGLKDKNGVEIYEGDIIVGWKYNPKGKHVVKFSSGKYSCGFLAESTESKGSIEVWYEGLEIIGNIHQNPELLEK